MVVVVAEVVGDPVPHAVTPIINAATVATVLNIDSLLARQMITPSHRCSIAFAAGVPTTSGRTPAP
jgi:hypothetical protein